MKNKNSDTLRLKFRQRIILLLILSFFSFISRADGTRCNIWIKTSSTEVSIEMKPQHTDLKTYVRLASIPSGKILWQGSPEIQKSNSLDNYTIKGLNPELWSPASPNLYKLEIKFKEGKTTVLDTMIRIGFRDFESRNGQIFLNGYPIFLRGIAINPPGRGIPTEVETSREFAEDYVAFMKNINVNIIRIPDNQNWYDVCDELGMMVFGGNYSGSVDGETPPKDYDKGVSWYENEKFQPIMHHPSLMIYALTNEVPYVGTKAKEWIDFLGYAHQKLKVWDNTRLYIGNAGYGYGQSGDICDLHRYWGWYYSSPFTFLHIRDYEKITFPDKVQPLTFTECVGNYTGPDGRYNLTPNHKNPVSQLNWTGHAPQNEQAMLADEHQCFVFKQATELMRRLRRINPESSGVFPFTIMFRNWHTIEHFADMGAKPVTAQVKLSYQPVLISWENWQSQVYAGTEINPIAHIINDSEDFSSLKNVSLVVRILDKSMGVWYSDTLKFNDIPYYAIHSEKVKIKIPDNSFSGEYKLEGILLSGEKELSRNNDPLFIENKTRKEISDNGSVVLYDQDGSTKMSFQLNNIGYTELNNFKDLKPGTCLVIGENSADSKLKNASGVIQSFIRKGGRLVVLKQDSTKQKYLEGILPVHVQFPTMNIDDPSYPPPARPSANSININPERPEHPAFAGISRERLRVWADYTGWNETKDGFPAIYPVTNGFVVSEKTDIGKTAVLANYSVGLEGIALAEFFEGDGSVLLSGFDLCKRAGIDPVADRLLKNCVKYMSGKSAHEKYVFVDAPILWGEYETEKGILTGINSGFMLNSKPALFGSYEGVPIILQKDGHMFAEKGGGWNNAAGKQYVPYGRRIFGPYVHRDFGGVPTPVDPESAEGVAEFWCRVPSNTKTMKTIVWNPSDQELNVDIKINESVNSVVSIKSGEYKIVQTQFKTDSENLKVVLKGDRRLVVLQTEFN